jgi:DNA-binding NarL/FixJ family response regulator
MRQHSPARAVAEAVLPATEALLPGPLLIVEHDSHMQARLSTVLTSLGYAADDLILADNIASARMIYVEQPCAIALVDIGFRNDAGIELVRDWHRHDPALLILVISPWGIGPVIVRALRAGAIGYLLKERDDFDIVLSMRSVLRGGAPIDPFIARHILEILEAVAHDPASHATLTASHREGLTPREMEILGLVSRGLTNKEIANSLSLSVMTVECHVKHIYKKLAVRSRTQAAYEARVRGLSA